jgi:hypothetical protein
MKKCLICNREHSNELVCSTKCRRRYARENHASKGISPNQQYVAHENRSCIVCTTVFNTRVTKQQIYCSTKCFHISRIGGTSWNKGLTRDTDERVLDVSIKAARSRMGKPLSEAHKLKIKNSNIGKHGNNPDWFGKFGIRKDLNQYFRSTWEANFARLLNYMDIKWEYEPKTLILKSCSYTPDFYLPELNLYIEVKGFDFGRGRPKLKLLNETNSTFPIKVLDDEGYMKLKKKYSSIIKNWEN